MLRRACIAALGLCVLTRLPSAAAPFDGPGQVNRDRPGPWDNDVVVYRVDDDAVEQGRKLYRSLLGRYLYCRESKDYQGVGLGRVQTLWLPDWAKESED